jgi:uncharacterized protein YlxW (UPF0749 family)
MSFNSPLVHTNMVQKTYIIPIITIIATVVMIMIYISKGDVAFLFFAIAIFFGGLAIGINKSAKIIEAENRKKSERKIKTDLEREEERKNREEKRKIQEEERKLQEEERKLQEELNRKKQKIQQEEKRKQEIEERNRQELERKKRIQENYHNFRKISQDSIDKVKEMRNEIVFKYDVDGNEIVDDIEENVFVGIIRNNNEALEKKIGADKVHKLVKLSIYLNKKRDNIQNLYGCFLGMYNDFHKKELKQEICIAKVIEESDVMFTTNISKFYFSKEEENIVKDIDKALYNELNTYKTMLFHSTSMVVSAKKGDLITFFEIYEVFDKLGVFDSNWENEVSSKLSDVSNKLSDVSNKLSEISNKLTDVSNRLSSIQTVIGSLIQSVNRMNDEIVGELISLNYIVDSSISSLEASVNYELQGIKSSVDFNNLLTSVNTYQMAKLNSKTNKLLNGR